MQIISGALFDTSSLDAIASSSNHSCALKMGGNVTGTREEELLRKIQSLDNEGLKIRLKVVLALTEKNQELFDVREFSSIPLELMPKLFELIQQKVAVRLHCAIFANIQLTSTILFRSGTTALEKRSSQRPMEPTRLHMNGSGVGPIAPLRGLIRTSASTVCSPQSWHGILSFSSSEGRRLLQWRCGQWALPRGRRDASRNGRSAPTTTRTMPISNLQAVWGRRDAAGGFTTRSLGVTHTNSHPPSHQLASPAGSSKTDLPMKIEWEIHRQSDSSSQNRFGQDGQGCIRPQHL